MTDAIAPWVAGQEAELNQQIVIVEHVTATGRAKVGDDIYNPDGTLRGRKGKWSFYKRLRHLTPEVIAEIAVLPRVRAAKLALRDTKGDIDILLHYFSSYSFNNTDLPLVEKAERVIAAVAAAFKDAP